MKQYKKVIVWLVILFLGCEMLLPAGNMISQAEPRQGYAGISAQPAAGVGCAICDPTHYRSRNLDSFAPTGLFEGVGKLGKYTTASRGLYSFQRYSMACENTLFASNCMLQI